ncbi:MAG: hypothetical protein JRJ25_05625, partial [Deltaproteobacteria bacterium]|nr:hypothetical protein [Deltaproteobacteria bacterium]
MIFDAPKIHFKVKSEKAQNDKGGKPGMKKWYSIVLLCVVFLFSSVVSSSAEISSEELLQILIEKGIITDKDIEKAKLSKEPA